MMYVHACHHMVVMRALKLVLVMHPPFLSVYVYMRRRIGGKQRQLQDARVPESAPLQI